jgi:hypothetical protein
MATIVEKILMVLSDRLMATRMLVIPVHNKGFSKHGLVLWAPNV